MKNLPPYVTLMAVLIISLIQTKGCKVEISNQEYLQSVYEELDKIKSASYYTTGSASAPHDTLSFSEPRLLYIKEFVNPDDEFVGASSLQYNREDTTRIIEFYDGFVKGKYYWEEKTIKVDSFQNYPYPIRLVYHPFYTKSKNIIKYALETTDSIKINLKDYGDSVRFSLFIYDKVVEFVTKPYVKIDLRESSIGKISQYDLWIRKSDNLPYRLRRKMNHQTSFETCSDTKLNTRQDVKFISTVHFPPDFKIEQYKRGQRKFASNLLGKTAPDWSLKDIDQNVHKLSDLKSKVLMIQFTGVGCGPCHHSIPFLKQLVEDYKSKDFEFVSIEMWSNNMAGLKRYQEQNDFNFKFLKSEEYVNKAYEVRSAPTFFILDENRVITKVLNGYGEGSTDNMILEAVNELL